MGVVAKFLQEKKGKQKVVFKEQINKDAPIIDLHRDEEEEVRTSPWQRVENEVDDESEIIKEAKEITVLARGYHEINKFIKKDHNNELVTMKCLYKNAKIQELLKLRFSLFVQEFNTLLGEPDNLSSLQEALGIDALLKRLEWVEKYSFHDANAMYKAQDMYWKWYENEEDDEDETDEDEDNNIIEKPKNRIQVRVPESIQSATNSFAQVVEESVNKRKNIYF